MKRLQLTLLAATAATLIIGPALADDLTIAVRSETDSVDPHWGTSPQNNQITFQIFEPLAEYDNNRNLQPGLATSWKPLDDKTWEFKLRSGVNWHDGSPFTADDVLFTADRMLNNMPESQPSNVMFLKAGGKTIKKIDDMTIHITTETVYPLVANDIATIGILSKKNATGAQPAEDFNNGKAAIGTGPYKFVSWNIGDNLVLAKSTNHWGSTPEWDKVTYKLIPSDPSRVAALLNGDVDLIEYVPTIDLPRLSKDSRVTVFSGPSDFMAYITVDGFRDLSPFVFANDGEPLWPNPLRQWKVRKALSKAIDRNAIVERVMGGAAYATNQIIPDNYFGWHPDLKAEPFDLEGAKKLLAEAGYPEGFQVKLHGPNDACVNDAKIIEAIAQMWTRAGIKTEIEAVARAVYWGRARKNTYSFAFYCFGSDTGESASMYATIIHSPNRAKGYGNANRGYVNIRFDRVIEEALATVDDAKREQLIRDAAVIAAEDVAVIPLHGPLNLWAARKGLTFIPRMDDLTMASGVSKTN